MATMTPLLQLEVDVNGVEARYGELGSAIGSYHAVWHGGDTKIGARVLDDEQSRGFLRREASSRLVDQASRLGGANSGP